MQDDFQLTIREAAKALGVSPSSCRRYLKQGKLEAIRETRSDGTERYLISRSSVVAYDPAAQEKLPPPKGSPEEVQFQAIETADSEPEAQPAPAPPPAPVAEATPPPTGPETEAPANDGEFLTELTSSLEREVETHSMVPVELYREIRTKHEEALERAARAEGELARMQPEIERMRRQEQNLQEKITGHEKELEHLREQLQRLNSPKISSMLKGFMGKAEG